MDYGMFEEALVDFFCREHHDVAVARSRAESIIDLAKGCDEELVGGDHGMEIVLRCKGSARRVSRGANGVGDVGGVLGGRRCPVTGRCERTTTVARLFGTTSPSPGLGTRNE